MDLAKVEAVKDWPTPKNLHKIQVFLGLIGWLRPFLKGFAHKACPLMDLMKKNQPFNWTKNCEEAFTALKELATSELALIQPDLEKPFKMEVDASGYAIGAVFIIIQTIFFLNWDCLHILYYFPF